MEEIISSGAVTEAGQDNPETGVDAGGQQAMSTNVVHLDDILSEAQDRDVESPDTGASEPADETVENVGDDGPGAEQTEVAQTEDAPKFYRTQEEFNAAFSKRMAKERAQLRPLAEIGRAIAEVAGNDLNADEVRTAVSAALADKRAKANSTDFETEMNNIRVEERVAKRFQQPVREEEKQEAPPAAEGVEARTQEMLRTIAAIGDGGFTAEALQANREAMAAWAGGASPAQVYREFFSGNRLHQTQEKAKRPAPERAANSGATGRAREKLTDEQIRRIDEALEKNIEISVI